MSLVTASRLSLPEYIQNAIFKIRNGNKTTAIYEKETGTCIIQKNKDYKNESVWMKDVLIFNDTPLEDVLKVLSRKYNVQFNIENEAIYSYTYTLRS